MAVGLVKLVEFMASVLHCYRGQDVLFEMPPPPKYLKGTQKGLRHCKLEAMPEDLAVCRTCYHNPVVILL